METASTEAGKNIQRFTDAWRFQKYKLMGHVLRTKANDPLHQVTVEENIVYPKLGKKRRVGSPRESWLLAKMMEAYYETNPAGMNEFEHEAYVKWLVNTAREKEMQFSRPAPESFSMKYSQSPMRS